MAVVMIVVMVMVMVVSRFVNNFWYIAVPPRLRPAPCAPY